MCGRYQLNVSWTSLSELYGLSSPPPVGWAPSQNISPTQGAPVVVHAEGGRSLRVVRWGFPAPWLERSGKDPWSRALINARSEDAGARPTWRTSFQHRRCLVPATSFIEWIRRGAERYPVGLSLRGQSVASLGGVWGVHARNGHPTPVFAILTTAASTDLEGIHDRMPVHVAPSDQAAWLDPATPAARVRALTAPLPSGSLSKAPLPRALNRPGVEPAPEDRATWTFASLQASEEVPPEAARGPAQQSLLD